MKKKSRKKMLSLLAACCLAAGCLAGCQEPQPSEETASTASAADPADISAQQESSVSAGVEGNSVSQKEDVAAGASQKPAADGAETDSAVKSYEVYSSPDLQISFIRALDYETNSVRHWLKEENTGDKAVPAYLENIVWNDVFTLVENSLVAIKPGETNYIDWPELDEAFYASGEEYLRNLSFRIVLQDPETYEKAEEKEVRIDLTEGTSDGLFWEPYLDAQAEEQVLLDNDEVKITLLHLGRLLSSDYSRNYLRGFVLFENKSDYERPVGIESISVNGLAIDVLSDHKEMLDAGRSCIQGFSVSEDDFAQSAVESIASVSLMILSDPAELTGTVALSGGSWYEIALSEAGLSEENAVPDGELIFDGGEVQIYLNGGERSQWSIAENKDEFNFTWFLTVINNREEDVELNLIDKQLDGAPLPDDKNFYIDSEDEIGYHSRRNVHLVCYEWPSEKSPEVGFTVQLRTVGGGAILYTSDQPTVIPAGVS